LFCFSLASLLFFMIVSGVLILEWFHKRVSKRLFWLSVCLIPLIPIGAYYSNIHIQIELDSIMNDMRSYASNPEGVFETIRSNPSGNQTRLLMWTVSAQEFIANPMGCGTANVDDVLTARLDSHGLQDFSAFKYNPHNQFLQVAVEIGILGLIVFLSVFVLLFRMAWIRKDGMLFWITFSLFFNCLFESMLQRQSGIVFYMILIGVFVTYRSVQKQLPVNQQG
jgi:O-antigen ligase